MCGMNSITSASYFSINVYDGKYSGIFPRAFWTIEVEGRKRLLIVAGNLIVAEGRSKKR